MPRLAFGASVWYYRDIEVRAADAKRENHMEKILGFISRNPGASKAELAKLFTNGRILPMNQTISCLMWSGKIMAFNGGYRAL